MKTLVEPLSFTSGAVLIAVASASVVWLLCLMGPGDMRLVWVVVVPFALAYSLYWLPVWFSTGSEYDRALIRSDYHNWQFVFLIPWFLAGAIPSAIVVGILRKRRV